MPRIKLAIIFLLLFSGNMANAQSGKTSTLKGRVLNSTTKLPYPEAQVTIPAQQIQITANTEGYFIIPGVAQGNVKVVISGRGIKTDTIAVSLSGEETDMAEILVTPAELSPESAELPTITLEENTSQEDENASATSQSSSGFYVTNQDPFLYTAAIVFGPFRFKPRGYDNSDVEINGIPLQDLETGFASMGVVGGLNDVLKDRTITYGLKPAEYSFGTVKGSTYINAEAANQRAGTSVSYQLSNGNIRNRVMVTHSSGLGKKGWAYTVSGSKRWSTEGYVPGTYYDGYSFFGGISKVINKGQFNLTAFGAPTKRGKTTNNTDEAFELAGDHYYNSSWGYQNGEKRNAHVANSFQPSVIANYTLKPSDKTRWNTAVGYEFGKYRNSNLDFYNGSNPNPVFYKKMPSYYLYGIPKTVPATADAIKAKYLAHPELLQVQWDDLYSDNYTDVETIYDVNGIAGNNVTGRRSVYVMEDAVDDLKKLSFNSNITHVLNENITLDGGLMAISQRDEYYKQLTDLLGGDFFVNYNQFAAQQALAIPSYVQNNLNQPNALIKKDDKYGYDYILRALQARGWGQGVFTYKHFNFFVAAEGGMMSFSREGLMRNGLFPSNSFGRSTTHSFSTYKFKGGFTYNLNPKNAVYVHASYFNDAPKIDYSYISAKGRDFVVNGIQPYKTKSFEIGYLFKTSVVNFRLTGYVTDVTGNTIIKRFWNDDPDIQSFVNYVMQNVDTRSTGIELVAGGKITKALSATIVAAIGQSFYTNNPTVSIYQDNSPSMTATSREVYLKNYYLGVGPQFIYSLGLKYSPRNYWHVNLNFNYMDHNYVEINPERHTEAAIDLVPANSQQQKEILAQEKLPAAFTTDLSVGKSFNVSKYIKSVSSRTLLNVNLGVNNLLNNTNIKTTGYEQLRYDFAYHNPQKFPNKYGYAYGINFFLTIGLKF